MADGETLPAVAVPLTPMALMDRALEKGADFSVLEKLMDLQERWQKNEAKQAFDEAISAAKAEIPAIKRKRHVGYESKKTDAGRTEYSHEDFAEIARIVNPILSAHGLSYRFRTSSPPDAAVAVTCIISHRLGYSEENTLQAPRDTSGSKNAIQAIGSTVTYLQRYTLKAALGLAVEDDDDGAKSGEAIIPAKVLNEKTGRMVNPNSSHQLRKNKAWPSFLEKVRGYADAMDPDGLTTWYTSQEVSERVAAWPSNWREMAEETFEAAHKEIEAAADV